MDQDPEPTNEHESESEEVLSARPDHKCCYYKFCKQCLPMFVALRELAEEVTTEENLARNILDVLTKVKETVMACFCTDYQSIMHMLYHVFDDFADVIEGRLDTSSMFVVMTLDAFVGYTRAMLSDMTKDEFVHFIAALPSRYIDGDLGKTDNFVQFMTARNTSLHEPESFEDLKNKLFDAL